MTDPKRQLFYGGTNFKALVHRRAYYVDKTAWFPLLEEHRCTAVLGAHQVGKSLLCTTLQCYYDINLADRFPSLFARTRIGAGATAECGQYHVLHFDFSKIAASDRVDEIRVRFNRHCNMRLQDFAMINEGHLTHALRGDLDEDAADNLRVLFALAQACRRPPFYVIIDAYDHFANQCQAAGKHDVHQQLMHAHSFLGCFFKTLQTGLEDNTVKRVMVTGVSSTVIETLAPGFHLANAHSLLGFSQDEIDRLLDRIYLDHQLGPDSRAAINDRVTAHRLLESNGELLYSGAVLNWLAEHLKLKS